MPEQLEFLEWRNETAHNNYPFADKATLTNGMDILPKETFLDARLYPIGGTMEQYLSKVNITGSVVTIYISDAGRELATGEWDSTVDGDLVTLEDAYSRPAGIFIGDPNYLIILAGWSQGDHEFTTEQTGFVSSIVVPTPQLGVRGFILADGQLFTKDVWWLGENGVYFSIQGGDIRVDALGDPAAYAKYCENDLGFPQPWPIKSIGGIPPGCFGDYKLVSGAAMASDTALRILPESGGVLLQFIGSPHA